NEYHREFEIFNNGKILSWMALIRGMEEDHPREIWIESSSQYLKAKDDNFIMRLFIYDAIFKVNEKTTQGLSLISFPNLLLTFYVKEALFTLASTV
ncbi:hypothetical protein HAX54_000540, partial [Datura stramonium]|nr:hypothetical protein [Datura stramonium]